MEAASGDRRIGTCDFLESHANARVEPVARLCGGSSARNIHASAGDGPLAHAPRADGVGAVVVASKRMAHATDTRENESAASGWRPVPGVGLLVASPLRAQRLLGCSVASSRQVQS